MAHIIVWREYSQGMIPLPFGSKSAHPSVKLPDDEYQRLDT